VNGEPAHSNSYGTGAYTRPDRMRFRYINERSMIIPIFNRIALDVSSIKIQHVRLDENRQYKETIDSGLNYILTTEANLDQNYISFIQDIVMSMFDEGVVAVVPVETKVDLKNGNAFDILTMRVGKIIQWFPEHVKVNLYDERVGKHKDVIVPKRSVAIIENPLYSVMNEPNSTLKRLIKKLAILDAIDEQSGAGKLDIIIQLPYVIKSEARKAQAETRRKDIEMQLAGSKYGIAYTDATEKITQLNRPAENNLMKQIEYLYNMLFNQLGLTEAVFNGTADEKEMLNYYNRTINPILKAITAEFRRTFLTKTARTQGQDIMFFKDLFSLMGASDIADAGDKFTRNEILSSNEIRGILGMKPSSDPKADELRNKNLNPPKISQEKNNKSDEIDNEDT
jgi:hypothetical protein